KCIRKLVQHGRLYVRAHVREQGRIHEDHDHNYYEAFCWRQIRSTLSCAIADDQLVLQQQGLCGEGTDATWAKQLRESHEEVDCEDDEVAHAANGTYHHR